MPRVVLKLFAGQGTGRTDKAATICFPLWRAKMQYYSSWQTFLYAIITFSYQSLFHINKHNHIWKQETFVHAYI